jgi:hypothetical protein
MVRVIPFDALDEAIKQNLESSGFTKGLHGYQSPQWRFFRNRSGISGIEQLDVDGEVTAVASAKDLDWQFLEEYLRNRLLTADRIGLREDERHR